MKVWANAIAYQLVWFAAIWGASTGYWWAAPLALLPFAVWYLSRPDGRVDAWLMPLAVLLGLALDSALAATDLVAYASAVPSAHAAPVWIISIWAAFSLTLRHSFRFLHGRPLLAAVVGAIGAPMAYLAAARGWHAVAFPRGVAPAMIALGLGWCVALPSLITLAQRFERRSSSAIAREHAHVA
ncbi:DUF2878 domain-containing protein [Dyella sp.]|jgi:hypothetical protein|uniref:DUF2878 domain-containing protein n=1 Tax=Dyella sp. TaxID=1869338 RepID=UPI002D7A3CC7|nr:DUF2878 domain-containing protein [Dyella sp.]HET6432537.1 DUF2878 domain-containing protein [Dyella sp.]